MKSPNICDISAVVCCWNSIDSIEECLKSLKKCGVGELIVVDGGSVDGTLEIAKKYADKVLSDDGDKPVLIKARFEIEPYLMV